MTNGRAAIADDSITVTTATRSEDEVRASLTPPADAKKVDTPAGTVVPGAEDAAKPDAAAVAEADSDKPDAALSEAGRTLRMSRGDARKKRITEEINEHVSRREKAREEADREEARLAALKKPATPPVERKPADADKPNADGKDSAAPKFTYPTYEQWQVDNPEGSWEDYSDARSDARDEFRSKGQRETEARAAEEREVTEAFSRADQYQKTFQAEHPDYETKLKSLNLAQYGVEVENGVIVKAPHQFIGLQRLLLRAGEAGPGILYYLADHPDDVKALLSPTTTPNDMLEIWGGIKYAAKASASATPKPAAAEPAKPAEPPAIPRTSAPAPMAAVPGSSTSSKTPKQLSEEAGEDADGYIAVREPRLLKRAGAGR